MENYCSYRLIIEWENLQNDFFDSQLGYIFTLHKDIKIVSVYISKIKFACKTTIFASFRSK